MSPFTNLGFLQRLIELLSAYVAAPDTSPRGMLYITAVCSLGVDASPNDVAPDEFGCAETVDTIHKKAFGRYITTSLSLSTARLYAKLKTDTLHWQEVATPLPGDIVISPTGYGNGKLSSGHVGIMSTNDLIMNNNSETGLFDEHYTLDTWRARYVGIGGFPMMFYRRIAL